MQKTFFAPKDTYFFDNGKLFRWVIYQHFVKILVWVALSLDYFDQ